VYVEGDPLGVVDPTGEFGVVGGAIGGISNLAYQLYKNGGNVGCVNPWEVASWAIAGSGAGIIARAGISGVGRFVFDPRKWGDISRAYWGPRGGAGPSSLDHWLITKAAGKNSGIAAGLVNAGFNLVKMPQVINSSLGGFLAPGMAKTAATELAMAAGRLVVTGTVLVSVVT